jgi:ATP-dependent exoDNAse (exonuclease V) beta subunit
MAILCHTRRHLDIITTYLTDWDIPLCPLADWHGEPDNRIKIGTIHRSKGLDFSAVYIPDLTPPPTNTSQPDDRHTHHAQREFVARTRPRDRLWIAHLTPRTNQAHTAQT